MNVYEESQEGGGAAAKKPKPDPVKEFKAMPSAERWLALLAAAIILVWIIRGASRSYWGLRVFDVCTLAGAVAILALVVPHLFGVKVLAPRLRMFAFAIAGVLPAAGFVADLLFADILLAAMLAGSVAMGLTAWQIAERERLLK